MTPVPPATPDAPRRPLSRRLRTAARRARDATPLRRLSRPTVSIIVPIYNVEAYVAECLDSVAAQTYGNYEVVVVDDGSPDGSRAVVERHAAADPRIRIITRPNGGLGAARNTGVRNARGRFLTFLDSDDLLPPQALQRLVDSATRTGSDIVAGGMRRFDEFRSWQPRWVGVVHRVRREQLRIEDFLPLIRNLYTCNKLFRRDFWDEQGLWFREGVAYEDQPLVTQLFCRAKAIDVIPEVVYQYRARDDMSSISQQTASLKGLRDRIEAWEVTRETLRREAAPAVYHGWLQTLFQAHFHWYLASPGTADDTYWSELQAAVVDFTEDAPQELWDATAPHRRVLLTLTLLDRRADAQEFVRLESGRSDQWESLVEEAGVSLKLPFWDDPGLDHDLFLIRPEQLVLAHSIENFRWSKEEAAIRAGTFEISGWAFVAKIDLSQRESIVSVVLRETRTGRETEFPSEGPVTAAFPPPIDDDWCDYRPGTFRATVAMSDVVDQETLEGEWEVLLRVQVAGFTVTAPVTQMIRSGSAGVVPATRLDKARLLLPHWRLHEPFRLEVAPVEVEVDGLELDGRTLSGNLSGRSVGQIARLTVVSGDVRSVAALAAGSAGGRSFRVTIPPAAGLSIRDGLRWDVLAETDDRRSLPVTMGHSGVVEHQGGEPLHAQPTRTGQLAVVEWEVGATADELKIREPGVLEVVGSVFGRGVRSVAVTTRNKKTTTFGPEVPVVDGAFTADLPLQHVAFRFGARPLPVGEHDLSLRVRTDAADPVEVPLKLSPGLNAVLPVPVQTSVLEGRVVRGASGEVRMSLVPPIGDARGDFEQHRLRTATRPVKALTRGVLMRSYFGEHATDNGVSIQQELRRRGSDLPVFWAVQDHSVPVPEGGVPVVVNSREWYELLSSVAYYVDNMYQPEYHRKPDGQVVVQTFHGYPFKKMGHPHWDNLQLSKSRIDSYDRRAGEWDYLVSPARYATPLLTRDFAYDGPVLEIGYPRNDVLLGPDAEPIRAATRASLGIEDGQTVVLHAPTFRDYLARGNNRAAMADFFDFDKAARQLGEGFVVLARGHAFNARSRRRTGTFQNIIDVTDYPEVSDLYLAADAAVVDYSSLRFDFAVTGKPMIFQVPDLQRYKDTRGWLFDFEPTAPGPLVDTTDEVVKHLRDLDSVRTRYAEEYGRFRTTYLDLEDGHAGQRFVDAVFAPRGDA